MDTNKKTIIFDFGNVLINLDFKKCFDNFEKVLGEKWSLSNTPDSINHAIQQYERGSINDEEFIWAFQQLNSNAQPRDIIDAWNSILENIPLDRLELLESLRADYNIALLSNINNFHLQAISKYLITKLKILNFEDQYFDKVYYSHLIGIRKPDKQIYEHVTQDIDQPVEQILFIDDLRQNIEAAQAYGWKGFVHDPKSHLPEVINTYIKKAWS